MKKYFVILLSLVAVASAYADKRDSIGSVVDEVIWVVGDAYPGCYGRYALEW